MSGKAIGGYVRRGGRRYVPPGPQMLSSLAGPAFFPGRGPDYQLTPDAAGGFRASLLGTPPEGGPPYTHVIKGPEVVYARSGKVLYWEPPGPAFTLTERP